MSIQSAIVCNESAPFIFISYAHRDSDAVYNIIGRLAHAGYNIWFDRGIEAGTNWDENIASHIERASCVLAFMSRNYLNSGNCKDELNYARDLNKELVLVYVDDVTLPSGMAMRLNRSQAVMWNEADDLYQGEDFQKILSAPCVQRTLLKNRTGESDGKYLVFKCPACGGNLPDFGGNDSVVCSYCGTRIAKRRERTAPPPQGRTAPPPTRTQVPQVDIARIRKIIAIVGTVVGVIIAVNVITAIVGSMAMTARTVSRAARENRDSSDTTSTVDMGSPSTSGTATKEKSEDEKLLEAAQPLVLDDFEYVVKAEEDAGMYVVCYMKITNPNEKLIAKSDTVNIVVRGEGGKVLDSEDIYLGSIPPMETGYYSRQLMIAEKYDKDLLEPTVEYNLFGDKFNVVQESDTWIKSEDIQIFNISSSDRTDYSISINGEVKNDGEEELGYCETVILFRQNGQLVYADRDYISEVPGGASKGISMSIWGEIPNFDSVEVYPSIY